MSNAQLSNTTFCTRPYCDKPTNFNNSSVLKPESCPSGKDGTGAQLGSAEYEALMARYMAGGGDQRETLCPPDPNMVLPTCTGPTPAAETGTNDQTCVGRGEPSGSQYPTLQRPTCLPPEAFADAANAQTCRECRGPCSAQGHICTPPQAFIEEPGNAETYGERGGLGDTHTLISPPSKDNIEDNIPPRIRDCKELPSSNVPPMDIPGTCRSAESNEPAEIRCCVKKCEISPDIFEKERNRTPDGPLTSEYYKTKHIPYRFDNASCFYGYGCQQQPSVHPFYRTTSQDYGWFKPTMHTVPTAYFPQCQKFSQQQGVGGRYRNTSLDTSMAEKMVED